MQCIAFALVFLWDSNAWFDSTIVPATLLLIATQGLVASALGVLVRLDWWWAVLNVVAPALVMTAQHVEIPSAAYLGAFLAFLAVYWTTFQSRVPLYLTDRQTVDTLATLLSQGSPRILDVGSGTGTMLRGLATRLPSAQLTGIEIAPVPHLISVLRGRRFRRNCHTIWGNLWKHPLQEYDCVYAFLSPVPMSALWRKACQEMRSGSLLVSNSFPIPDVEPTEIIDIRGGARSRLHLYRIPARDASAWPGIAP